MINNLQLRTVYVTKNMVEKLIKDGQRQPLYGYDRTSSLVVNEGENGLPPIGVYVSNDGDLVDVDTGLFLMGRTPDSIAASYCANGQILPLNHKIVDFNDQGFARVRGVADPEEFGKKRVLIAGAGSVGSLISIALAQQGIGNFILVDKDHFEPGNISRHACDWPDVGRSKVEAVADAIKRRNPSANVEQLFLDINTDTKPLLAAIRKADLVVSGLDDEMASRVINRYAVVSNVPAVYCAFYDNAAACEVIYVIPKVTSCYECLMMTLWEKPIAPSRGAGVYGTDDTRAIEPGLSIDIIEGTAKASAIALAILESSGKRFEMLDFNHNRLVCHSGSVPQSKMQSEFDHAFDTHWTYQPREQTCGTCGDNDYARQYASLVTDCEC